LEGETPFSGENLIRRSRTDDNSWIFLFTLFPSSHLPSFETASEEGR